MSDDHTPYDGQVTPDGPAQHRPLGAVVLSKLAVGDFGNNAYLLRDASTGEALLVDAAADWPRIQQLLDETGARVTGIVTTHRHPDHTGALEQAVAATGATTYAGRDDAEHLPVPVQVPLDHEGEVRLGDTRIGVIGLRGHTPGSVALDIVDDEGHHHLISGDSLFPGGVGATTRFEYQSFPQLYADVVARIFDVLPDSTWVYPGHGNDTTLGTERPHLAEWKERGW